MKINSIDIKAFDFTDNEELDTLIKEWKSSALTMSARTSGSTGEPKTIEIHKQYMQNSAELTARYFSIAAHSNVLLALPLTFIAGKMMVIRSIVNDWNLIITDCTSNPHLPDSDLKFAAFTPMQAEHLVETQFDRFNQIETVILGGGAISNSLFLKLKKCRNRVFATYGMTENTISTSFNRLTDPIEVCCQNRAPILGPSEVKIIDPVTQQEQPRGSVGEIWCRGETVMLGYYKNPEATRATITVDGWLKTGDLGRFDTEGFLSVTGRLKDMYKTGGTNVYPAEVEQFLVQHPAIAIVAIVGVPDTRLDEVGFAFIQTHPGMQITHAELRAFCKGKLADYKVPRYLKLLKEIPRTTTGKVQRSALLELASAEQLSTP